MGESGDTTTILPVKALHVILMPGPYLICRHCGAIDTMNRMPLGATQAIREIREFMSQHANCPPPRGKS